MKTQKKTQGFVTPHYILKESNIARSRLAKKPAGPEEVKEFLFRRPTITTWRQMSNFVDKKKLSAPESTEFSRLSHFTSKFGGRDGKAMVQGILDRRDSIQQAALNTKSYRYLSPPLPSSFTHDNVSRTKKRQNAKDGTKHTKWEGGSQPPQPQSPCA